LNCGYLVPDIGRHIHKCHSVTDCSLIQLSFPWFCRLCRCRQWLLFMATKSAMLLRLFSGTTHLPSRWVLRWSMLHTHCVM